VIDRASLAIERRTSASPIWVRLRDTFTGGAPRGPVLIQLERRVGQEWVTIPYRLSSGGDLAAIDLGRSREPGSIGRFTVRVRATVEGVIADPDELELLVDAWAPDAPPVAIPIEWPLFPGPAYAFPPGTPILAGQVVENASGAPVARAEVTVDETIRNTTITEEVRCDQSGRFRLPVRWSSGATTVNARKDRPAPQTPLTGSIVVNVPDDLSAIHRIPVA
jgi:hypothetical protein